MHARAAATDDVAHALGHVALAPAAVVVTRADRLDLEPRDLELVTGGDLADLREAEISYDVLAAARHDEMRLAIDRLEAPAIEMIYVRVRDQNCIDAARGARTPRQQRIEHDACIAELRHRGRMAEPRDTRTCEHGQCGPTILGSLTRRRPGNCRIF